MKVDINNKKFQHDILPELSVEIERSYNNAQDFMSATIYSTARESYDYYYGRLPIVQFEGTSTHTDRTVSSTVNAQLADLTTVFTTGEPVRFTAESSDPQEVLKAQIATDTVNQIILRQNDGQKILEAAIKEALIVGTSFIKHYWNTTTKRITERIVSASSEEEIIAHLMGLKAAGVIINDEDVKISEPDEKGNRDVEITYTAIAKSVKLDFVPIEQILIEENCVSLDECNYICHRGYKTKQELLDLGFPKDQIDALLANYFEDDSDVVMLRQLRGGLELYSTTDDKDDALESDNYASRVLVNEHYFKTDKIANDGTIHLYQIMEVNRVYFSIEEVDALPFSDITPAPMGGTIWGESVPSLTKDIQNLRTQIKRYLLDYAAKSAYPSYVVMPEVDSRALTQAIVKPGTVIRADMPAGAITTFPNLPMPQELEWLYNNSQQEIADRTGVNPTQQGINSDLVHSAGLDTANVLLSAAQSRMRMYARTLANTFVKRLMRNVYEIFRNNAEVPLSVDTAYGVFKVSPTDLAPRDHIKVATALSNHEKSEESQRIMTMVSGLGAIAELKNEFVTPQQKHFITTKFIESLGYRNTTDFIVSPDMLPPEQPDQMMLAQLAVTNAQAGLLQAQTQEAVNKAQESLDRMTNDYQIKTGELQLKNAELIQQGEVKANEHALKSRELDIKASEVGLKHQHNAEVTDVKRYEAQTKNLAESTKAAIKGRELEHSTSEMITG